MLGPCDFQSLDLFFFTNSSIFSVIYWPFVFEKFSKGKNHSLLKWLIPCVTDIYKVSKFSKFQSFRIRVSKVSCRRSIPRVDAPWTPFAGSR